MLMLSFVEYLKSWLRYSLRKTFEVAETVRVGEPYCCKAKQLASSMETLVQGFGLWASLLLSS